MNPMLLSSWWIKFEILGLKHVQAQNRGWVKNGGGDQITEVGMTGSLHLEAKGVQKPAVGLSKTQQTRLRRGAGCVFPSMPVKKH